MGEAVQFLYFVLSLHIMDCGTEDLLMYAYWYDTHLVPYYAVSCSVLGWFAVFYFATG